MHTLFLCSVVSIAFASELRFNHINNQNNGPRGLITDVVEDPFGFIWFATKTQILRFDGHEYKSIDKIFDFPESFSASDTINLFHINNKGEYWIGTQQNGAYRISQNVVSHFSSDSTLAERMLPSNNILGIFTHQNGDTWLVTGNELIAINSLDKSQNPIFYSYPFVNTGIIKGMTQTEHDGLLIAHQKELISFNPQSKKFSKIAYDQPENESFIWDVHLDESNRLWLSTDNGLYLREVNQSWQQYLKKSLNHTIKSIESGPNFLWLGTAINGLIRINLNDSSLVHYQNDPFKSKSLLTDETTRVYLDSNKTLWVSHFDGRVSYTSLNSLDFGLNIGTHNSDCFSSDTIYDFHQTGNKNIWMVTHNEVVRFNEDLSSCEPFKLGLESEFLTTQIYEDQTNMWIASTHALHLLKIAEDTPSITHYPFDLAYINFIEKYGPNEFLVGTVQGMYLFNQATEAFTQFGNKKALKSIEFKDITVIDKDFLLSSNKGLFWLIDGEITAAEELQKLITVKNIMNTSFDHQGNLWIGTNREGLYKVIDNKEVVAFNEEHGLPNKLSIRSVIHTQSDESWVATDSGLYRFKPDQNKFIHYTQADGLQSDVFNGSSMQASDGRLFFGGRFGYNAFYPNHIKANNQPPEVAITEMTLFNKRLDIKNFNDIFSFDQDINDVKELTLTHKDYVVGFEFTALDYADPTRNKYAYQLQGFVPDWSYVDAKNRHATYTNLPRGEYVFRVKAANKDGYWNEQGKSIKIKVLPAPWLSWWAITFYVFLSVLLLSWLINRKLKSDRRIANLLRVEVKEKTKELQLQKQTVESLLVKKNELFANVSHEFRTPLTLILGPMDELIESSHTSKTRQSMMVLKRNANRLLSLVEQLLHLAKTSDFQAIRMTEQSTEEQIKAIVESFQHLAKDKKIQLILKKSEPAYILATEQCLDATLGNLISNAIKYSPANSMVEVSSEVQGEQLIISVTDQGAGLTEKQTSEIFKRFKRLDTHSNIAGIGIGLAVAKELVEINQGSIFVTSEYGKGSTFTISLPKIDKIVTTTKHHFEPGTLIEQLTKTEINEPEIEIKNTLVGNKNIVLVIEDNHDMRNHIVDVLGGEYSCLQAANGKEGVANAIKFIPDLIICDVMMPELDGFKVSRIIRSDQRTSHIPLILLTALNDRENRIKGWRENVDVYMTKPFDREELLIQVDNIITIRNILKKKARITLNQSKTPKYNYLPKKDADFVKKLLSIIKNEYQDQQLNRDKIAAKMAVSERQLQRKIKALIDQNPMDMLREYRLTRAAEKIKEGYQIALCSDEVGFKSPAHFSQLFKAQYGMTPKQYQQQFSEKTQL